jgi:hypothetical protein
MSTRREMKPLPVAGGTGIFNQLLPARVDNRYRGYKLALWLFGVVMFMKIAMSLNSIFNGYTVATSADGIPLDTFTSAGAQTVLSLFALLGLSQFLFCLLGILVLVRYRSLIPFMYALLLLEYLSRRLIIHFIPVVRTGTPPGLYVNLALLAVMIVGLALSLRSRGVQT